MRWGVKGEAGVWWQSTGVIGLAVMALTAMGRGFAKGWRESRDRRERKEMLARVAAGLRAEVTRRSTGR